MRKIKKNKKEIKTPKKPFFDTKGKIVGASIVAGVLVILLAVIMFFDLNKDGHYIVKNDTDMKLEYVKTSFALSDEYSVPYVQAKNIKANTTYSETKKSIDLGNYKAIGNVAFKFANHKELNVDAGTFSSNFTGDLKVTFTKTDDPDKLIMTVKAERGLLSAKLISCDDKFTVDFKKGIVFDE